jgi:hypothetical protein
MEQEWSKAQSFEKTWWLNTREQHASEIEKSDIVAKIMMVDKGLPNKTVIDIGAGPLSLLQRLPVKEGTALDPIFYEDLEEIYTQKGIKRLVMRGEDLEVITERYDEAWIYNCLQHVVNPTRIIKNAMEVASIVRIFEWINIPPYEGHLHMLTQDLLEKPFITNGWTNLQKSVGHISHSGLDGDYYFAIFRKEACPPNYVLNS